VRWNSIAPKFRQSSRHGGYAVGAQAVVDRAYAGTLPAVIDLARIAMRCRSLQRGVIDRAVATSPGERRFRG